MPSLFWSGKLSLPMKLLVEANNVLSFLMGSSTDISGMKERVKSGYEGEYSDHVRQYDELGYHLQDRSARIQLEETSLRGMRVLDVGCGTGALAHVALERGAEGVVCGDISAFMLNEAKGKGRHKDAEISFCQLDAESLPYTEDSFDAVISGMTFGTLPNQELAVHEMIRVARPGGLVCIGAHGPEHYWEAIDATLRCINKRYVLGYRFEWWPRTEEYVRALLEKAHLEKVRSKRVIWRNEFGDGAAAYDFFAAISSSWWYARFPPEERKKDSRRTRGYFQRKNVSLVSDDIVIAYGTKPKADPGNAGSNGIQTPHLAEGIQCRPKRQS
jgi:ubiquinone/menaquinone biosynthesis C-methylase UbiE